MRFISWNHLWALFWVHDTVALCGGCVCARTCRGDKNRGLCLQGCSDLVRTIDLCTMASKCKWQVLQGWRGGQMDSEGGWGPPVWAPPQAVHPAPSRDFYSSLACGWESWLSSRSYWELIPHLGSQPWASYFLHNLAPKICSFFPHPQHLFYSPSHTAYKHTPISFIHLLKKQERKSQNNYFCLTTMVIRMLCRKLRYRWEKEKKKNL